MLSINIPYPLTIIFNIKYYLNIFYNYKYNLKILLYKLNKFYISNSTLFNNIKNIFTYNRMFNFRNKINFNKSKKSLCTSSKTGRARINKSSSHLLKNSIIWFGFRNLKLNNYNIQKYLLLTLLTNKKNKIIINNLEIFKFIYNTIDNKINLYNNILNTNYNITLLIYPFINYKNLFIKNYNLNLIY